jgi:hypothetical protein
VPRDGGLSNLRLALPAARLVRRRPASSVDAWVFLNAGYGVGVIHCPDDHRVRGGGSHLHDDHVRVGASRTGLRTRLRLRLRPVERIRISGGHVAVRRCRAGLGDRGPPPMARSSLCPSPSLIAGLRTPSARACSFLGGISGHARAGVALPTGTTCRILPAVGRTFVRRGNAGQLRDATSRKCTQR